MPKRHPVERTWRERSVQPDQAGLDRSRAPCYDRLQGPGSKRQPQAKAARSRASQSQALPAASLIGPGRHLCNDILSATDALAWVHGETPGSRHVYLDLATEREMADFLARLHDVLQIGPADDAAGQEVRPGPPEGAGRLPQQDAASIPPSDAEPVRVVGAAGWRGSPGFVATQSDRAAQRSTADLNVRRPDFDSDPGGRSTQEIVVGNLGHRGDLAICRRQHGLCLLR